MNKNTFEVEKLSSELFGELMMALKCRKHQLTEYLGWGEEELDLERPYSAASQLARIETLEKRFVMARYPETYFWRDV